MDLPTPGGILVPLYGSDPSRVALAAAVRIARALESGLHFLHVVPSLVRGIAETPPPRAKDERK